MAETLFPLKCVLKVWPLTHLKGNNTETELFIVVLEKSSPAEERYVHYSLVLTAKS